MAPVERGGLLSMKLALLWIITLCVSCQRTPSFEYKLLRCGGLFGAVRRGGICELPLQKQRESDRIIRVLIEYRDQQPNIKVEGGILEGDGQDPGSGRPKGDGSQKIYQIHVWPQSDKVVIRDGSCWGSQVIIPIAPYEISEPLVQALDSWKNDRIPEARKQLEQALDTGSPQSRARARRHLAKFMLEVADQDNQDSAKELVRLRRVERLHQEAAQLAHDSGELWDEVWNILNQATVLQGYLHQSAAAERILYSPRIKELSEALPGLGPWISLYRGEILANTDPYRALAAVEDGMRAAEFYLDKMAKERLCRQRSLLLHSLGRAAEARAQCDEQSSVDHCRHAYNLLVKAQFQLMRMEDTHRKDVDPSADLAEVIHILRSSCQGSPAMLDEALIAQAQARLLAEEFEQISDDDLAHLTPQDPVLRARLLAIRGDLALLRSTQGASRARLHFKALREFALSKGYHAYAWHALIGLARSHEQDSPQEAEQLYSEALQLLAEWATQLPLGLGHGSFLMRHEEGLRRYVDFLLRQGRNKQALEAVRQTRTLGLRVLMLTKQLETLPVATRESLYSARTAFEQARLDRNQAEMDRQQAVILKLLPAHIDAPRFFPLAPPPPLDPGVVLFTCYPVFPLNRPGTVDRDWACFATRGSDPQPLVARVGEIDPTRTDRQLSQQLLAPFMKILGPAQVVRVLSYGLFSAVPMHLLPLPDRSTKDGKLVRLGDQRPVVYALDLPLSMRRAPAADAPAPTIRSAFVIVGPGKEHPGFLRCSDALNKSMRLFADSLLPFRTSMTVEDVFKEIERASFVHYAGHVSFDDRDSTYGLALSTNERLSAGALLGLARAPEQAVLIGCASGSSHDGSGEGVALGVAQALIMRGTREVIGTERIVQVKSGVEFGCQLYQHLAPKNTPYPLAAALQRAVEEPSVEALGSQEQGAFRSYVF